MAGVIPSKLSAILNVNAIPVKRKEDGNKSVKIKGKIAYKHANKIVIITQIKTEKKEVISALLKK